MTKHPVARAEVVGSLLRPESLLAAKRELDSGAGTEERLRRAQDEAVLDAIRLQESVGVDVITDGEMRRATWIVTAEVLDSFEVRPAEHQLYPASVRPRTGGGGPPVVGVVRPVAARSGRHLGDEYDFLREHATVRTKYTLVAPSYHRRFWTEESIGRPYRTCEEFLEAVRDWTAEEIRRLAARGCDYFQLDAPNYGSLCDPQTRQFHHDNGRDVDADLAFDARLDSSVFDGVAGVTRAVHVCRGNLPGGGWHSSGGYAPISGVVFPALDVDVLLLEYDSDRAGDFAPLKDVRSGTTCVLGLVSTKTAQLEDEQLLRDRIREAAGVKPLDELALSTQCGFASVAGDNPTSVDDQRTKLELVARLARDVWA